MLSLMTRWLISIGICVAGLMLSAYLLPFRDVPIEGGLRGVVPASDARLFGLILAGSPLLVLILLAGALPNFRAGASAWKAGLIGFLISFLLLAWSSFDSSSHAALK